MQQKINVLISAKLPTHKFTEYINMYLATSEAI